MQGGSFVGREDRTRKGQLEKVRMLYLVGTNTGVSWRMPFSQRNTREENLIVGQKYLRGVKTWVQLIG